MVGEIHAVCNKFGLRALVGVEGHMVSKSQEESLGGYSPYLFETEWIQYGATGADSLSDAAVPLRGEVHLDHLAPFSFIFVGPSTQGLAVPPGEDRIDVGLAMPA